MELEQAILIISEVTGKQLQSTDHLTGPEAALKSIELVQIVSSIEDCLTASELDYPDILEILTDEPNHLTVEGLLTLINRHVSSNF